MITMYTWTHNTFLKAAMMAVPFLVVAAVSTAQAAVADTEANYYVKEALRGDDRVDAAEVTATTKDGIVTLTGSVANLAAKKYAVDEAKKINGVLGVIDEITVSPSYQLDSDIGDAVRRRILNSPTVVSQNLHVTTKDGVVTLSGTVDSYAERYQAELLASEVHGVKEVKNSIFTKWESSRSDQEIKNDVLAALERDVYLSGLPITASVEDGTVTLSGSVGNAYEKQRAADDARWISNVTNVKNDLGVKWYEEHGVRGKKPIRTEEQLAASVYDALRQDTRVPSSDIHVNVQYGHVTLDGSVYTRYEEQIAEEDAQNVVGVAWVSNHLFARADKRADWAIAGDVDFNLATDAVLDGFDIDTNVKDGIVTLSGQVHSWYERSHADSVASRVKGVKDVINNIEVARTNWKKDGELVKSINDRLKGDWTTWWVTDKINVTVKSGVATLEGDVNKWDQRTKAGDLALHVAGISEVDNRLTVKGVDYPWDEYHYK
jgi:osmotically-inducible protein OsmY